MESLREGHSLKVSGVGWEFPLLYSANSIDRYGPESTAVSVFTSEDASGWWHRADTVRLASTLGVTARDGKFWGGNVWIAYSYWHVQLRTPPVLSAPSNQPNVMPTAAELRQNFPNPFNPRTTIEYFLQDPSHISLKLYDVLGREAASLWEGFQSTGLHRVTLDGSRLSSGVYFCRLRSNGVCLTKKLVLLR